MKKKSMREKYSNDKNTLPCIRRHYLQRKVKISEVSCSNYHENPIRESIRVVQRSIEETMKSMEKLEACLSKQHTIVMKNKKRAKSKFRTEPSINLYEQEGENTNMRTFYQNIHEQKSIIKKRYSGKENLSLHGSVSMLSQQNDKKENNACLQNSKQLFNNIKRFLDKRYNDKNSQIFENSTKGKRSKKINGESEEDMVRIVGKNEKKKLWKLGQASEKNRYY